MKTLSIRQPWAWAILHAGKRIENRDWRAAPSYRGPLLIHASKGCTHEEWRGAVHWMFDAGLLAPGDVPPLSRLDRGGIVGVCDLVDVILPGGVYASKAYPANPAHRADSPWYVGALGLVLDNVRPLSFLPLKGVLGFFDATHPEAP
jgi:hypothetical protein